MTQIRVWAPLANQLDLYLRGAGRWTMWPQDSGWWSCEVPELPAGTDYGFCIDGGDPLPDPRSASQPYGVNGLSRTVDHKAFDWQHNDFRPGILGAGVIYELHLGTFTPGGTFLSAIERLQYLKDLGVTHVEVMPVAEFSGSRGWGYDGVHLYAPHHSYGTPDDLKRLVDEAHGAGLSMILDVVYNHLGPSGNYLGRYGPYFTDRYKTPWGEAVNLDGPGSDEVQRFLTDNAMMWLRDYQFDGLRLDAVHAMPDQGALSFLEQLALEVEVLSAQTDRSLTLIAESNLNDPRLVWPREAGGYGLNAVWCDDFHHAMHTLLTGESSGYYADFGGAADLAKAMRDGFVYDGRFSVYRQRRHGRPALSVSPHRLVVATQTHDQVGNRANGERFVQLAGTAKAKIAAALMLLAPQVPMLFEGEEWAASTPFLYFTNHQDPELGRLVSEGRRQEFADFGWSPDEVPDPQDESTFTRSVLKWDEAENAEHAEMLTWYRELIQLRRDEPDLRDFRPEALRLNFDEQGRWLRMRRGALLMLVNLTSHEEVYGLGDFSYRLVMASEPGVSLQADAVHLPGESVAVLKDVPAGGRQ